MALLTRIVVMIAGFLVASAVAASLMATASMLYGIVATGLPIRSLSDLGVLLQTIVLIAPPTFVMTVVLTLLPTLIVAVVAEIRRLRSVRYYVIAGAVVGAVARFGIVVVVSMRVRPSHGSSGFVFP